MPGGLTVDGVTEPAAQALADELVAMAEEQFTAQTPLAELLERDADFAKWAETAEPTLLTAKWVAGDPPWELAALFEMADRHDRRLMDIIELHGWPGRGLVGEDGADAAWVIAQHADRHHAERNAWLTLVEQAARLGGADPRHFARLSDRVALVDGRPQLFGTYAALRPDGTVAFDPAPEGGVADVDARRAAIGLPPVADDLYESPDAAPYRWMRTTAGYRWPSTDDQ